MYLGGGVYDPARTHPGRSQESAFNRTDTGSGVPLPVSNLTSHGADGAGTSTLPFADVAPPTSFNDLAPLARQALSSLQASGRRVQRTTSNTSTASAGSDTNSTAGGHSSNTTGGTANPSPSSRSGTSINSGVGGTAKRGGSLPSDTGVDALHSTAQRDDHSSATATAAHPISTGSTSNSGRDLGNLGLSLVTNPSEDSLPAPRSSPIKMHTSPQSSPRHNNSAGRTREEEATDSEFSSQSDAELRGLLVDSDLRGVTEGGLQPPLPFTAAHRSSSNTQSVYYGDRASGSNKQLSIVVRMFRCFCCCLYQPRCRKWLMSRNSSLIGADDQETAWCTPTTKAALKEKVLFAIATGLGSILFMILYQSLLAVLETLPSLAVSDGGLTARSSLQSDLASHPPMVVNLTDSHEDNASAIESETPAYVSGNTGSSRISDASSSEEPTESGSTTSSVETVETINGASDSSHGTPQSSDASLVEITVSDPYGEDDWAGVAKSSIKREQITVDTEDTSSEHDDNASGSTGSSAGGSEASSSDSKVQSEDYDAQPDKPKQTSMLIFLSAYIIAYLVSIFWQHALNFALVPALASNAFCDGLLHSYVVYSTSLGIVIIASMIIVSVFRVTPQMAAILLIPVSGGVNYYALTHWPAISVRLRSLGARIKHLLSCNRFGFSRGGSNEPHSGWGRIVLPLRNAMTPVKSASKAPTSPALVDYRSNPHLAVVAAAIAAAGVPAHRQGLSSPGDLV